MQYVPPRGVFGDLPARDFLVSPGFAGLLALLAGIVVAGAVLFASRRARQRVERQREQDDRRHQRALGDAEKALAWERWQWVVDTAGMEPAASEGATLGLGPAVTLELLSGLLRDAERLGDETLARAVAVYHEQLVLVLAQQAGPVSNAVAAKPPRSSARRRADDVPQEHLPADAVAPSEPETAAIATTSAPLSQGGGGRRRR